MLEVRDLSVAIEQTPVLREVELTVSDGSFVALIGRNGAGKTTFMRSVMGLVAAQRGTIRLDGDELVSRPDHVRAALGVGYMPEDRRLVGKWTAEENILLPAWATRSADSSDRLSMVYDLIPEVRALAGRRAAQLSGGQQKLVALGRALLCGRRLLLLDEPFEGVAPALARRLGEILAMLRRSGGFGVLVSESDYTHSTDLVDRVFQIERGGVRPA